MPDMAGVLAAANTAAIDFFAGQADGLGNGQGNRVIFLRSNHLC